MGNSIEACLTPNRKEGKENESSISKGINKENENERVLSNRIEELENQMKYLFKNINQLNEEYNRLKRLQDEFKQQQDNKVNNNNRLEEEEEHNRDNEYNEKSNKDKTRQILTNGYSNNNNMIEENNVSGRLSEYADLNSSSMLSVPDQINANLFAVHGKGVNHNSISAEKMKLLSSIYSPSTGMTLSTSTATAASSPYSSPYNSNSMYRNEVSTPPTNLYGRRKYNVLDEHLLSGSISADSYALALSKMAQNESHNESPLVSSKVLENNNISQQ